MMEAKIEHLRQVRDDLQAKLASAQQAYDEARIAAYKWQPGTVLRNQRTGALVKVVELSIRWDSVRCKAAKRNKDGTFGKALAGVADYYDVWEQVEL